MKRRSFLALAAAGPLAGGHSRAADDESGRLLSAWWETVERRHAGTFVSEEGELRLEVAMIEESDPVTEETVRGPDGVETVFTFAGEKLPRWVRPSDGVLKRFRFFWNDKEVPIEKRFWNDFGGCRIQATPLTSEKMAEEQRVAFEEFVEGLDRPKVILSADGGTALIEWRIIDTEACCGHRATVRWIIGKSGAVMRHRHTTPSEC
jgi:hypothetical protein